VVVDAPETYRQYSECFDFKIGVVQPNFRSKDVKTRWQI